MRWPPCLLCLVLVTTWAVTASASQGPPAKSDQEILIELEQNWNEAFYSKDIAFIEAVLADEFVATYDDGSRGDREKELTLAAEFNQQVESAIPDEFVVRVYGDTAVVNGIVHVNATIKGENRDLHLRYLNVWVKRGNGWVLVARQATNLPAQN